MIFRTGSLGDSVCALPAIYAIRQNFPEAIIHILTNAGANNLVSLASLIDGALIDEIIDYRPLSRRDLFKELKKNQFDAFIQLPQYDAGIFRQIRDMFVAKLLGVSYGLGWEVASTRFLANYQEKLMSFLNERDRLLHLLTKNGLKTFGMRFPLGITEEIQKKIKEQLCRLNLRHREKNIGMVVGAKRPQNRWPLAYFQEVVDELVQNGYSVILFGGKEDIELCKQIHGARVYCFCGQLTPLETAEMMKYCRLVITNDTGPMHLAYAVGIPVIALFSGRDYSGKWFPPEGNNNMVFRKRLSVCNGCFNRACENTCLKQLLPAVITEQLREILGAECKK